jgi:uncharacterized peroxidase-related enzyme
VREGSSGIAALKIPSTFVREGASSWLREPDEAALSEEVRALWVRPLEKLGFVPNVLRLFALRPSHLLTWNAHFDELMTGDSGLTKAEREMIAVVVSVANRCAYCIAAHSAALRKLTRDPALADAIVADHRTAAIDGRMRAVLDYALKLTVAPAEMREEDVEALRREGLGDEDVMDVAEVAAMFNFTNRMASGLGWVANPEYEALGR